MLKNNPYSREGEIVAIPLRWRESHTRLQVFSDFSSCLSSQELVTLVQNEAVRV
nr:hypothetical protein [uncultured Capnocytophaga sp.]